jgi:hypothetical protein
MKQTHEATMTGHVEARNTYRILVRHFLPLRNPRIRRDYNIKMGLGELGCEDDRWNEFYRDRVL